MRASIQMENCSYIQKYLFLAQMIMKTNWRYSCSYRAVFESGSHLSQSGLRLSNMPEDDLAFLIFLYSSPQHWKYSVVPVYLTYSVLGVKSRTSCMFRKILKECSYISSPRILKSNNYTFTTLIWNLAVSKMLKMKDSYIFYIWGKHTLKICHH